MTNKLTVKNRLGVYLYIFIIGLISTVTMRTIACFNDFNITTGYFGNKALINASDITMVAFMLVLFLHAFSHGRKDSVPRESFGGVSTYVPLGGLAVSVLFLVLEMTLELWTSDAVFSSIPNVVKLIAIILGLLSVVTFILNILIESRLSQLRGAFTIATVLFFAMYSINVYFSADTAANAPAKILSEFAFLMTAIFFLYEARISIGHSKWHSYTAFGLMATLLLAYTSLPALIYYIFNDGALITRSATELAAMLMLALFIGARTLLITFAPEDEVSELADSIIDMNYERNKNKTENSLARESNLNVGIAEKSEGEIDEAQDN